MKKIETFADLKEFVNSLDEVQLSKPVIAHRTDDWSHKCTEATTLEEDYHIDDYGTMVPNSAYDLDPDDKDDSVMNWTQIPKGTPYLYFDHEGNWSE